MFAEEKARGFSNRKKEKTKGHSGEMHKTTQQREGLDTERPQKERNGGGKKRERVTTGGRRQRQSRERR